MIEALFVGNDSDVRQAAEENHRPKLELIVFCSRRKRRPIGTRRTALELYSGCLETAPNEPGTVETFRPGAAVMIMRAQSLFDCRGQRVMKACKQGTISNRSQRRATFDPRRRNRDRRRLDRF